MSKKTEHHPISKRNACIDAVGARRDYSLHIRTTLNARELLGRHCLPALRKAVAEYAQKARRTAQDRRRRM